MRYSTFAHWVQERRKHRGSAGAVLQVGKPRFVELRLPGTASVNEASALSPRMLAVALVLAYRNGLRLEHKRPIQIKSHGHRSKNIFRYGLEDIIGLFSRSGFCSLSVLFSLLAAPADFPAIGILSSPSLFSFKNCHVV